MEDNNDEPMQAEPSSSSSSNDERMNINDNDNENHIDSENDGDDDEDAITISDNEGEEERRLSILESASRNLGLILQAMRHPLRTVQRNVDTLGFLRGHSLSNGSSGDDDDDNDDRTIPDNAESFDTDLPAEHSYLGNSMVRVSGVDCLEPNKEYRLLIFMHHSMLFPGETLPMITPDYMFDSSLVLNGGILFGLVFSNIRKMRKSELYGVTCEIYEKGNDSSGNVILKSRAHQRFVIREENNPNFSELLKPRESKIYANVRILPEIVLPDPLSSIDLGSMNRFRNIKSMSNVIKRMQASTTVWPQFIYDQYDITPVIEKAKQYLSKYKIESMPNDMTLLSFWLARNLLLDLKKRIKVFLTNSVNVRMKIIENALDNERYFGCRRCKSKIARGNSLFAMSKHGVQTNYCNPSGFIHETNTVYTVLKNSVYPSGVPSTEFSWFPSYSWQIVLCRVCDTHIGWKFASTKSNLFPKKFYGLSGTNLVIIVDVPKSNNTTTDEEDNSNSTSNGNESNDANGLYVVLNGSGSGLDVINY